MLHLLSLHIHKRICDHLDVEQMLLLLKVTNIITQHMECILKNIQIMELNGDFMKPIYYKFGKDLSITKILNVKKYAFNTGFIRLYNTKEKKYEYRYEFCNTRLIKLRKRLDRIKLFTGGETITIVSSTVIRDEKATVLKLKITNHSSIESKRACWVCWRRYSDAVADAQRACDNAGVLDRTPAYLPTLPACVCGS